MYNWCIMDKMSDTDLVTIPRLYISHRATAIIIVLSYGLIVYTRVYRKRSPMYNILLILISILFMIIAAVINYSLYIQLSSQINKSTFLNILTGIYAVKIITLIVMLIILYRLES